LVEGIIIVALAFIITGLIVYLFWKSFLALYNAVPVSHNRHYESDYWDDAGDGSGVNYVVMPNGEVRID
jgi:hypothetical protein